MVEKLGQSGDWLKVRTWRNQISTRGGCRATGRPAAEARIKFRAEIASAREANLMEDLGSEVETSENTLRFNLGPYEIKTFRLRLLAAEAP